MRHGSSATYVMTSDQMFLDGRACTDFKIPKMGQSWMWQGEAKRLDGPQTTLLLDNALGEDELRRRAKKRVRRQLELQGTKDDT